MLSRGRNILVRGLRFAVDFDEVPFQDPISVVPITFANCRGNYVGSRRTNAKPIKTISTTSSAVSSAAMVRSTLSEAQLHNS
jgi:hypothetical protein